MELSAGNVLACLVTLLSMAASWGAFQFQINNQAEQVQKIESNQSQYLRADVQAARNEIITVQLNNVLDKLERMQKVLDDDAQKHGQLER